MPSSLPASLIPFARAMAPEAWAAQDANPTSMSQTDLVLIVMTEEHVRAVAPMLVSLGLEISGTPEEPSLGDDLERVDELIDEVMDILRERKAAALGDLDGLIKRIEEVQGDLEAVRDDIVCVTCGEYSNDGEGFDGECGNCADKSEEDVDEESERETEDHPTVSDRVRLNLDDGVDIRVASLSEVQPHLNWDVWSVVDENGDTHLIEDTGCSWQTVSPLREDIEASPQDTFTTVFHDDECKWRGVLLRDGEPFKTTDGLFPTQVEALIDAIDLAD